MAPFRCLMILKRRKAHACALFAAVFCLAVIATPYRADAITAAEMMKKMSQEQRIGYLTGLIDMLAYQTAAHGDREKGNCIVEKFYREGRDDTLKRTYEVMEKFADTRPEILLTVLANKLCQH